MLHKLCATCYNNKLLQDAENNAKIFKPRTILRYGLIKAGSLALRVAQQPRSSLQMVDVNPLPPNWNATELVYDTEAKQLRKAKGDEVSTGGALHNKYIVCAAIGVRTQCAAARPQPARMVGLCARAHAQRFECD